MRLSRWVLRFVGGLLGVLAPDLGAAATVDCGTQPIRLAFYEYGLLYFDKGKGIDKDIVDELKQRSGCQFDVQIQARARIWADLAAGKLDMSVSGIQTAERDRFAWFAHYLSMKNYALVHRRHGGEVSNGREFVAAPGLQFGVVRAFRHGVEQDAIIDRLRLQNRVQESPQVDLLFRKLKDQRIDAMFSQPPVYRKLLEDVELQKDVVVQDWTPGEKGVPHGLILAKSRFSETEAANWRALVEQMRADGSLRRIYLRYLPAAEADRLLEY